MTLWQLDTLWGCGGVWVDDAGRIVDGAPIFRRLLGQRLDIVIQRGRYHAVQVK
jgi:hypothetical protein